MSAPGTHTLRELKLKRVSLVGEPANEHARVVLFKSAEKSPVKKDLYNVIPKDAGDDDVMCSKCDKAMKANLIERAGAVCPNCGAPVPAGAMKMKEVLDKITDPEVRKAVDALVASIAADRDAAVTLATEAENKRVAAEKKATPAPTEEDLLKNIPESIRKRLEASEASAAESKSAILKMQDERTEREYVTKAKGLGNLSQDPTKFGPVLKRVAQGTATEADVAELDRVLRAANETCKSLFRQRAATSGDGGAAGSAWEQIRAKARELRETVLKSGDKLSEPDAIDRVIKEQPELYERYRAENMPVAVAAGEQE